MVLFPACSPVLFSHQPNLPRLHFSSRRRPPELVFIPSRLHPIFFFFKLVVSFVFCVFLVSMGMCLAVATEQIYKSDRRFL